MAENLKKKILEKEKAVDIICGPDAYRDLPHMLAATTEVGQAEGKLAAFRTSLHNYKLCARIIVISL